MTHHPMALIVAGAIGLVLGVALVAVYVAEGVIRYRRVSAALPDPVDARAAANANLFDLAPEAYRD